MNFKYMQVEILPNSRLDTSKLQNEANKATQVTYLIFDSFLSIQVTETGWGEFEVQIKIHFHDAAAEKPVTVYHVLKLFHAQTGESTSKAMVQGRTTVVSEFYDEIVFQVKNIQNTSFFIL